MKTTAVMTVLLTALLTVFCVDAADVTAVIPEGTGLVARIDVKTLRESPIGQDVLNAYPEKREGIRAFLETQIGFDPDTVHTAWLVTPKPGDAILLLEGAFAAERIRQTFGTKPNVTEHAEPDIPFAAEFWDEKEQKMKLGALLADDLLAVGPVELMEVLLAARQGTHPVIDSNKPALAALREAGDTLVAVTVAPVNEWPDMDPAVARALQYARLTANTHENLDVSLVLHTELPSQAEALGMLAQGLARLHNTPALEKKKPLVSALLGSLRMELDGNQVLFTASIPQYAMREHLLSAAE